MPITQRCVTHISELDVTLRARVHEEVAMDRMELGGSDDFGQFFHIHRFDVDDI